MNELRRSLTTNSKTENKTPTTLRTDQLRNNVGDCSLFNLRIRLYTGYLLKYLMWEE